MPGLERAGVEDYAGGGIGGEELLGEEIAGPVEDGLDAGFQ